MKKGQTKIGREHSERLRSYRVSSKAARRVKMTPKEQFEHAQQLYVTQLESVLEMMEDDGNAYAAIVGPLKDVLRQTKRLRYREQPLQTKPAQPLHTTTCAECGNPFTPKRSDAVTCSGRCRVKRFRATKQQQQPSRYAPPEAVPMVSISLPRGVLTVPIGTDLTPHVSERYARARRKAGLSMIAGEVSEKELLQRINDKLSPDSRVVQANENDDSKPFYMQVFKTPWRDPDAGCLFDKATADKSPIGDLRQLAVVGRKLGVIDPLATVAGVTDKR